MAFLETPRFPDEIAYWCEGGPQYRTQVAEALSGYEQRNQGWSQCRCKFDIAGALRQSDETINPEYALDTVINYFHGVKARLHGFRIKDFTDYKDKAAGRLGSGIGDGTTTAFQMKKRYTIGAFTTDRDTKKPVAATIQVFINAVLQSSGYTLNSANGVVTFSSAPSNGVALTWTGQFDVPVRFDTDALQMRMEGGLYTIASLNCIEIRVE